MEKPWKTWESRSEKSPRPCQSHFGDSESWLKESRSMARRCHVAPLWMPKIFTPLKLPNFDVPSNIHLYKAERTNLWICFLDLWWSFPCSTVCSVPPPTTSQAFIKPLALCLDQISSTNSNFNVRICSNHSQNAFSSFLPTTSPIIACTVGQEVTPSLQQVWDFQHLGTT